ncbi:MAG: MBL fold metallo-hydrolase [Oscillospiraceae bacterium]
MKLTFIRADHEVTGSCTMLEIGGHYGLIDCGMEQGKDVFENIAIPVDASTIDFVLVTHAHMDHTGRLPLLYKRGFRGSVYATEATCDLCGIMLRDAAHIQMSDAQWKARKAERAGLPAPEPLYDLEDVEGLLKLLRPCSYGERIQISENVVIRFTDVGHLLGSACIEAWLTEPGVEKKIVFSGDVGNVNQPILRDPQTVDGADYVMIESTYGDRYHGARPDYISALADCIQRTLDRGGNLVIPAFAVGRTQEMLYFIRQIKNMGLVRNHPNFPVYVDSPLANEATGVFLQTSTEFIDDEARDLIRRGIDPLYFEDLHTAVSQQESMALNTDKTPKVILSASGMCDAGRIRHHLKYNLWRPESTVLFVGYQAVGTLGRKLHDGAKSVKLFGDEVAVNAEITYLAGVSGHADKQGLLNWLNAMTIKPSTVFVNHGDDDACTAFTQCLREEYGYNAYAPYSGSEFDLAAGAFTYQAEPKPIKKETPASTGKKRSMSPAFERLLRAGEALLERIRKSEGSPNKWLGAFAADVEALLEKWK